MNRQTVINKFIEKAGELETKPSLKFAQGATKQMWGITSNLMGSMQILVARYFKDHNRYPNSLTTIPAIRVLPNLHYEINGWTYDWYVNDFVACMRILENKPFKHLQVQYFPNEPLPLAINRPDCDISILIAPYVMEIIPEKERVRIEHKPRFDWIGGKPTFEWVQQMPNSTFWLVEFKTVWGTFTADLHGYPIGRMLKCKNCGNETTIQDWVNRKIRENHPECMCSCNTYDDFCGCMRKRENQIRDRLWKQARQAAKFRKRNEA